MSEQQLGALLTMPLVVINMGTEMVYILAQRLEAQSIPSDKARRGVLVCFFVTELVSSRTMHLAVCVMRTPRQCSATL